MCECRTAIDTELAASNAKIGIALLIGDGSLDLAPPLIVLEKVDEKKRGRLPNLVATYCPFCGVKYTRDQE